MFVCLFVFLQRFTFRVLPSDILEVIVRDKFTASRPTVSHFLGKIKEQFSTFLQYRGAKYVAVHVYIHYVITWPTDWPTPMSHDKSTAILP